MNVTININIKLRFKCKTENGTKKNSKSSRINMDPNAGLVLDDDKAPMTRCTRSKTKMERTTEQRTSTGVGMAPTLRQTRSRTKLENTQSALKAADLRTSQEITSTTSEKLAPPAPALRKTARVVAPTPSIPLTGLNTSTESAVKTLAPTVQQMADDIPTAASAEPAITHRIQCRRDSARESYKEVREQLRTMKKKYEAVEKMKKENFLLLSYVNRMRSKYYNALRTC